MKEKNRILFLLLFFAFFVPLSALGNYQPEARLTFTFDDINLRIYNNAAPIFIKHEMPAVIYGETLLLDSSEDWVMTWSQLKYLRDRFGWEIGSHTINHPDLTKISDQQLETELLGSKQSFDDHGIVVKTFATPMGRYDARVLKAISRHYESHRAAWGGANIWPQNDYELLALEVKHKITPETVMEWVDQAIANKQWLVLLLHDVVDGAPEEYEYNKNDLEKIVDYAASKPIEITTISEGVGLNENPNLVLNGSFELIQNNFANTWARTDAVNVTVDQNQNGNAPAPQNSLKIVGGRQQREAISGFIYVENTDYVLKMFQNGQNLITGGWAVWVNEYNANNQWIGGQWLGGNYEPFFGARYYSYIPASASVSKIKIHIFTEAGSVGTLYIDSVEFFRAGGLNPSPPPLPLPNDNLLSNPSFEEVDASGFAVGWTNNNASAVVIDANNNGFGEFSKNSLKIAGSSTQNTAFSPWVKIDEPGRNYEISYYALTENWQSGGTAIWINEFGSKNNWLGGQWLGGRYEPVDEVLRYVFEPLSFATRFAELHLFTEEGSQMTLYIDDISVIKK